MSYDPTPDATPTLGINQPLERPEDYLSPQQRRDAIADILATIILRHLQKRHDENG
ncbi:MAG: hypothetical protein JOZ57_17960 [Abitibacteriaceae bacterium]|nr:hypothetical protein [Abditibacteriaceae bacterium]